MGKLSVEAEIIAFEKREDGLAIVFQSDKQVKTFTINLVGGEDVSIGDQTIIDVSIKDKPKPKKSKKASSKDLSNGNTEVQNG